MELFYYEKDLVTTNFVNYKMYRGVVHAPRPGGLGNFRGQNKFHVKLSGTQSSQQVLSHTAPSSSYSSGAGSDHGCSQILTASSPERENLVVPHVAVTPVDFCRKESPGRGSSVQEEELRSPGKWQRLSKGCWRLRGHLLLHPASERRVSLNLSSLALSLLPTPSLLQVLAAEVQANVDVLSCSHQPPMVP